MHFGVILGFMVALFSGAVFAQASDQFLPTSTKMTLSPHVLILVKSDVSEVPESLYVKARELISIIEHDHQSREVGREVYLYTYEFTNQEDAPLRILFSGMEVLNSPFIDVLQDLYVTVEPHSTRTISFIANGTPRKVNTFMFLSAWSNPDYETCGCVMEMKQWERNGGGSVLLYVPQISAIALPVDLDK